MSRPDTGRRIEQRRAEIYDAGLPIAPFSSRLIHANYADRGIAKVGTGPYTVTGYEDVVGNRDWVQADTTKQPAYGLFTSQPALVFDDVNDFMASPSLALSAYPIITIAWAFKKGATAGMQFELSASAAANAGGFYAYEPGATTLELSFRNTASDAIKTIGSLTAGNVYRVVAQLNASAAATAWSPVYLNGVSNGTGGTADRGLRDDVMYMGMRAGTSLPWGGSMGDNLIYAGALSVAEIGVVDAFLASRCT